MGRHCFAESQIDLIQMVRIAFWRETFHPKSHRCVILLTMESLTKIHIQDCFVLWKKSWKLEC